MRPSPTQRLTKLQEQSKLRHTPAPLPPKKTIPIYPDWWYETNPEFEQKVQRIKALASKINR